MLLLVSGCDYLEPKHDQVWLIPSDYRGWLIIIPHQPEGVEARSDNGHFLFEFPESGVIKIKSGLPRNFVGAEYFFVDSEGNREKILYSLTGYESKNLANGEPYLCYPGLSFPAAVEYEKYYKLILMEKGKSDREYPRSESVIQAHDKLAKTTTPTTT
ncbi:MAG: hypothetical protein AAFY98_10255 [Verrucomicrobiota bacterium]